jgi:hypothetical protein
MVVTINNENGIYDYYCFECGRYFSTNNLNATICCYCASLDKKTI